jgi:hypothetical protein
MRDDYSVQQGKFLLRSHGAIWKWDKHIPMERFFRSQHKKAIAIQVSNSSDDVFRQAFFQSLRSGALAASLRTGTAGLRAGFATGIVLVFFALLSTSLASLSTQRHHRRRHGAFASFDCIARAADIGAVQAQLDALFTPRFIHTSCRAC